MWWSQGEVQAAGTNGFELLRLAAPSACEDARVLLQNRHIYLRNSRLVDQHVASAGLAFWQNNNRHAAKTFGYHCLESSYSIKGCYNVAIDKQWLQVFKWTTNLLKRVFVDGGSACSSTALAGKKRKKKRIWQQSSCPESNSLKIVRMGNWLCVSSSYYACSVDRHALGCWW